MATLVGLFLFLSFPLSPLAFAGLHVACPPRSPFLPPAIDPMLTSPPRAAVRPIFAAAGVWLHLERRIRSLSSAPAGDRRSRAPTAHTSWRLLQLPQRHQPPSCSSFLDSAVGWIIPRPRARVEKASGSKVVVAAVARED